MTNDDQTPTAEAEEPVAAVATTETPNDEAEEPEAAVATNDNPPEAPAHEPAPSEPEASVPEPQPQPEAKPEAAGQRVPEAAPVEAAIPPALAQPSSSVSDEDLFEAAMASLESDDAKREASQVVSKGDRIEAKVIMVEKDRVFVDLGTKAEGVVPLNELTDSNVDSAVGLVSPGDTFEVVVLKTGSAEGNAIVSKKRADFDQTWQRILDSHEDGTVFQAQVIDRVKGGLVVDIGVRGFVPATHVGTGRLRNIEKYVGQTLAVKIIEIDRDRKKVVLSNRDAESERREEVRKEIFDKIKTGDTVQGTVRRLTDYGAFVDLGGVDGLLHISEMSWYRIAHPREVLREGDDITVQVLRYDQGSGRISLGLRQVLPDPWNMIRENYKVGQRIQVKVGRIVQSGAFVRLPEGAEAFLPLSECSNKRVKKAEEAIEEGQEIEPMIIDLRADDRRMVLSLRDGAQPMTGDRSGPAGDRARRGLRRGPRPESSMDAPAATMRAPTGGATIGERLGMLKGILRGDGEPAEPEAQPQPTAVIADAAEAAQAAVVPETGPAHVPEPEAPQPNAALEPEPEAAEPEPAAAEPEAAAAEPENA